MLKGAEGLFADEQRPLYEVKANLFKGLAHPYRIKVLEILVSRPGASVAEMLTETGLEASHLSQHLAVLRRYRLVVSERHANVVFYQLAHPQVADLLRASRELLGEMLDTSREQLDSFGELPRIRQEGEG